MNKEDSKWNDEQNKKAWWMENFNLTDFERLAKIEREKGMFALTRDEQYRLVNYMEQLKRRDNALEAIRRF